MAQNYDVVVVGAGAAAGRPRAAAAARLPALYRQKSGCEVKK